ncbi:diguanylate cyclase (GGDEF)-like protein [Kineococcus radiotolerans]|uniref:Diguanylate cyclase (GGDEF)-like protein n=1 Tax=Kineococcus radiotolerans TaxID=131568 RepID=A0A7W4TLK0_KINRA|nr:GGDEF domain-containing protein [Kineococcus radiotolerans]MBB2901132.1 diguanylate cyclase (GGDEF)-like protein [Kineococcus radiotolerans]
MSGRSARPRAARGPRRDLLVLAAVGLLGAGYLLLPAGRVEVLGYAVLAWAAALVLVRAVATGPDLRPWRAMVAAQLLFALAETVSVVQRWQGRAPFPSGADAVFLLAQGLLFLAVLRLLPAPRGGVRRGALLDTVVVTTSTGLLFAVYTVLPAFGGDGDLPARLVAAAYPLCDVAVVFLLVRVTGWRDGRPRAFWLLTLGLGSSVVADVTFAVLTVLGEEAAPRWVRLLWLVFYGCVAAAGCGPSAGDLGRPPVERRSEPELVRLPLLAAAALAPPVVLVVEHAVLDVDHGLALGLVAAVVVALVLVRLADLLRVLHGQAEVVAQLAGTDPLTGLPNRRAWDAEVDRVFARAAADPGLAVTVAIVDLDRFKAYNDAHGHDGGDDLLVTAARAWRGVLPGAFLARWGGEEFAVLLPGLDADRAGEVLRAVHAAVPHGQTCSIGVATWDRAEVPPAVLARADAALYRAKRTGRDRTVHAEDRAGDDAGDRAGGRGAVRGAAAGSAPAALPAPRSA